jgi:hypothetical protein
VAPEDKRRLSIYTAIVIVSTAALVAIGAWTIAVIYAGLLFALLGLIAANLHKP